MVSNATGETFRISRRDIVHDAMGAGPSLTELITDATPGQSPASTRSLPSQSYIGCHALNYSGQCSAATITTLWTNAQASWRATLNYSFLLHGQRLAAPAGTVLILAFVPADPMDAFRQQFQAFFQFPGYASFLQSLPTELSSGVGFQVARTRAAIPAHRA